MKPIPFHHLLNALAMRLEKLRSIHADVLTRRRSGSCAAAYAVNCRIGRLVTRFEFLVDLHLLFLNGPSPTGATPCALPLITAN